MRRIVLCLCTLCLLCGHRPAVCHAERRLEAVMVLRAVADATLHEGDPETPRGADDTLLAGYDLPETGVATASGAVRALLRFDLATIPPDATIQSATLMLRLVASWDTPETNVLCTFQPVLDPWDEATVTWETAPTLGERLGWIAVPHGNWDWYSLDLTEQAQAWHSGEQTNNGLLIQGDESRPNWRGFSSREGLYPAQLVLTWTQPEPTTTPTPQPTAIPTLPPPTPLPTVPPLLPGYLPLILS